MTGGPVNPATRRCDDTITLIDRVLDLVDNPTQRAGDRAYPPMPTVAPADRLDDDDPTLTVVELSAVAARRVATDPRYDEGTRAWARAWQLRFEQRGPRPDPLAVYQANHARTGDG